MHHLFESWDRITQRVEAAKKVRLYLDFDGTLVRLRPDPQMVKLRERTKLVLGRLARHEKMEVAILSGRRRAALVKHIRVPGVEFYGLYGWDDGRKTSLPPRMSNSLNQVRKSLALLPKELKGISLEDKEFSLALHFRAATVESKRRACLTLLNEVKRFPKQLHIIRSYDVWDVVPRIVHGKGAALRRVMRGVERPFLGIYVGDDANDEPAFAAMRHGITVRVGPVRKTNARYWLRNPREVWKFLKRLEVELP